MQPNAKERLPKTPTFEEALDYLLAASLERELEASGHNVLLVPASAPNDDEKLAGYTLG